MRKFNPEKELEILRMYREGRTQKQIADELNTYNTSIRRVLIRNGIIPKGNDKQQSGSTLRFYICGKSVVFIKQIETFLVKNGYSPRVTYIHDLWYVNLYRVEDVIRIGEQLYNNAHIFCRRKYERWLAFYENRRANGVNSGEEMAIQS